MPKFMAFKLPTMQEPHVWVWIVDQERMVAVKYLYDIQINNLYDIFHNTYLSCKTEGMTMFSKVRGNK